MKKLWLLTKVSLGGIFHFQRFFQKKNWKQNVVKSLGIIGVIALCLIIMGVSFSYSYGIGIVMSMIGELGLLPEIMMAVTSIFILVTTISRVKGTLFGFKDYDLVMSLPVKTSIVVSSRLFTLYLINLGFTIIVMVPAWVAYGILGKPSVLFYIYSGITLFFLPFIPIIIGTILGTVIVFVASKFRYRNILTIIFSLLLFVVIMLFSFLSTGSESAMIQSGAFIAKKVDEIYPLARMYKEGVIDYNIGSLLLFIFISCTFFLLYGWIVGHKFNKINTSILSVRTNRKLKNMNYTSSSPLLGLYKKELRRYFSSPIYVLNTGVGMIMLSIASVASLFISDEVMESVLNIPDMEIFIGNYLPIAVSLFVVMVYTSACSISLEGNNLWIIKSAPVTSKTIFHSKIAVNLTIILPLFIVNLILLTIGLQLEWIHIVMTFAFAVVYGFFIAIFGLVANLLFPRLEWKSETAVIKQSMSTLIAMFGGIIAALLPAGAHYLLFGTDPLLINIGAIIAVLLITVILYNFLVKQGNRMFVKL